MDRLKRESLVRRICNRKLYGIINFQHKEFLITVKDPTLELIAESDWIYKKTYEKYKDEGNALTLEESYEILIKDGLWSDKFEQEINTIKEDLPKLIRGLESVRYRKNDYRSIQNAIDSAKKRLSELERQKNQLYGSTAEGMAEEARKKFLMRKCVESGSHLPLSDSFIEAVAAFYYIENGVTESEIREIARTDPWRLYWSLSKNNGTPLFRSSSVEITSLEFNLVVWSKIYDFAYESVNRPGDEIINDDLKFDCWFESENKRIEEEIKKTSIENVTGKPMLGPGTHEVFLPADLEGAKEVYKLNSDRARSTISERQKAIIKYGEIKESQLPDTQRELKMEANRMSSKNIMERHK